MKKPLQYDSLIGFATKNSKLISGNYQQTGSNSKQLQLSDILYREYVKINNIEVTYYTKQDKLQKIVYISKNASNFNGGSISLPFKSSKAILNTKVQNGFYTNTWVALQNRNQYTPKLIVNGKKYVPVVVNGAFLKYQFHASKPNNVDGKPENEVTISVALNPINHVNSIVGIWFG
jgi:hypothetical protein